MARMQQESLEAQRRAAVGTQTAQVLGGGKSLTIRPGASAKNLAALNYKLNQ